jgi:hypothetical protein
MDLKEKVELEDGRIIYCEDCFHYTRLCNKAINKEVRCENCIGYRAGNDE